MSVLCALTCFPVLALAQEPRIGTIWESRGYLPADIAWLPDMDGDGSNEFLVGHVTLVPLQIYHGRTRSVIQELSPDASWGYQAYFGHQVLALGDVDGDGVCDIAASAPWANTGDEAAGAIRAYSGADWSELWTLNGWAEDQALGRAMHDIGDVNGDGAPDLAVSSYYAIVRAISGRDGTILWATGQYPVGTTYGDEIERIRDRDGDGVDELMINCAAAARSPIEIRSGRTGALIQAWAPAWAYLPNFGGNIEQIDDVSGDGWPDLLISEAWESNWSNDTFGKFSFVDGRTGQRLAFLSAEMGYPNEPVENDSVVVLENYDGDEYPEILTVNGVWSVDRGVLLRELPNRHAVAYGGDAHRDGRPDLLAGDVTIVLYGLASPTLKVPPLQAGVAADLTVTGAEPSADVHFFVGPRVVDTQPLGDARFLLGSAQSLGMAVSDASGTAQLTGVVIPPQFTGRTLHFQGVVVAPGAWRAPTTMVSRVVL